MNELTETARALAALGHEHRLAIYRLLVRAGKDGLSVGAIAGHVGLPASTLAHHLSILVDTRLVDQERQGRNIINRADYEVMRRTLNYLSEQCCTGVQEVTAEAMA